MTAGHNTLRGSGPDPKPALTNSPRCICPRHDAEKSISRVGRPPQTCRDAFCSLEFTTASSAYGCEVFQARTPVPSRGHRAEPQTLALRILAHCPPGSTYRSPEIAHGCFVASASRSPPDQAAGKPYSRLISAAGAKLLKSITTIKLTYFFNTICQKRTSAKRPQARRVCWRRMCLRSIAIRRPANFVQVATVSPSADDLWRDQRSLRSDNYFARRVQTRRPELVSQA